MQPHQEQPGIQLFNAFTGSLQGLQEPLPALQEVRNAPLSPQPGSDVGLSDNSNFGDATVDHKASPSYLARVSPANDPSRQPRVDATPVNSPLAAAATVTGISSFSPFTNSNNHVGTASAGDHASSATAQPLPACAPSEQTPLLAVPPSATTTTHVQPSVGPVASASALAALNTHIVTTSNISGQQNAASPSQAAVSPIAGAQGHPTLASKPGEATGSNTGPLKPVLKMRRTGQGLPLNPSASSSLHRRHVSSSHKTDPGTPKAQSPGLGKEQVQTTASKYTPLTKPPPNAHYVEGCSSPMMPRPGDSGPVGSPATKGNPGKLPSLVPEPEPKGAAGIPANMPAGSHPPQIGLEEIGTNGGVQASHKAKVVNDSFSESPTPFADDDGSDDDIRYEATTHTSIDLDSLHTDGFMVIESSSDATDSETDIDSENEGEAGASFQQQSAARQTPLSLHQVSSKLEGAALGASALSAPSLSQLQAHAQASASTTPVSAPSSAESSLFEEDPHNIPCWSWFENGREIDTRPAVIPDGYAKSTEIEGYPWICSIRSCRLVYKTLDELKGHFLNVHGGQILNDNRDGTVSVLASGSFKSIPPYVRTSKPLDGTEAPIAPAKKPKEEHTKPHNSPPQSQPRPAGAANDLSDGGTKVKNAKDMWEYMRPYLSKHHHVPHKNWVPEVIHLPRVRDMKWNEARIKDRPFQDSHPRDVTAFIIHVTGVEAPEPCEQCAQGKGPFEGCIMISPDAPPAAKGGVLSCANCYYHCGQSQCSHCRNDIQRRERNSNRVNQKPATYNERSLSDQAQRKTASSANSQTQGSSQPRRHAAGSLRRYGPTEFQVIEMASQDRSYKTLKGKGGEVMLSYGALIPEGYELDTAGRWICPVLTCRALFPKIVSLGGHFSSHHCGELYNDNGDGTLSPVGFYAVPAPGLTHRPAAVISQNHLEGATSMANAKASKTPASETDTKTPATSSSGSLSLDERKQTISKTSNRARLLWEYILPYLAKPYLSFIQDHAGLTDSRAQLSQLFQLPRQRDIKWRADCRNTCLDDDFSQIGGLLVHLVGEEYNFADKARPCTNCVRNEGPFDGCYVLSRNAPPEWHALVQGCANCYFTHHKQACSIKSSWQRRVGDASEVVSQHKTLPPTHKWAAVAAAAADTATSGNKRIRISDLGDETESSLDRFTDVDDNEPQEPPRKIVKLNLRPRSNPLAQSSASTSQATRDTGIATSSKGKESRESKARASALVNAGQVHSGSSSSSSSHTANLNESLEMEDWEIAPGRIRRSARSGQVHNLAFSKSYLETGQPVPVSIDANFEVRTVKSGHSFELDPVADRTRYCSLASGKLRVCLGDEPAFTIGPHGMFKVEAQQKARVQNRLYIDSVVHIVSSLGS